MRGGTVASVGCVSDRGGARRVSRAYGVPVEGGDWRTTEARRSSVVRGRPNWWVILAVSLALMALLVATAGGNHRPAPTSHGQPIAPAAASAARTPSAHGHGAPTPSSARHVASPPTTTSTTTTTPRAAPAAPGSAGSGSSLVDQAAAAAPPPTPAVTTTTAAPAPTTSTIPSPNAVSAARTQTQGYLDPPVQTSNHFAFNGTGAMQISVLWSGAVYLTMTVTCPNGSQTVGGTSAMGATLPDASGSCMATVSEPASESAVLTYTITIGPPGG
jgi:hypothetical protein